MKKILLIVSLCAIVFTSNAQMALNEVYVRPGNGQSEFFEIYNNAKTNININLDCFTVLTYWKSNSNSRGWYVLDLPPTAIAPSGYYVAASASPFNTQNNTGVIANLNWNSLPAGASLTMWQWDGAGGYTQLANPVNLNNFFEDVNGITAKNTVLMYKEGVFAQGFLAASGNNILDPEISSLPALTIPGGVLQGACSGATTFNIASASGSPFLFYVNPAAGNDNGYSRLYDGNCAPWDKSAPGNDHTPGATNNNHGAGGTSPYDGTIVTAQLMRCLTPNTAEVVYNITGVTGAATVANSFPTRVQIFDDLGTVGQYDPGVDVLLNTNTVTGLNQGPFTYNLTGGSPKVVILYSTANGCYDEVFALQANCIILPVDMKSFTAVRNGTNVNLKWETMNEQNCRGFAVERNNGNGIWQEAGFISTQAVNGNSADLLTYTFIDYNDSKTITQYRIRQVDTDNRSKLSNVQAVRGLNQKGSVTVYPNPTNNGNVNVVFEDKNTVRELSVVDMSGRVVKQLKNVSGNNVSIENLQSGMYTLRVYVPATGEQAVEKIVVNRR